MNLPDCPLSPEAEDLFNRIRPKINGIIDSINRIPVSILIWGQSPENRTPYSDLRIRLRSDLRGNGHAAFFSEELVDSALSVSLRIQQLAQAQSFDLIVSIPSSFGSLGEVHDFIADSRVNSKILVFINNDYRSGYSVQSLESLRSISTCEIEYYDDSDLNTIYNRVISETVRMREIKYLLGGRF